MVVTQISSRRRIWCRGVLTPSNHSVLSIPSHVSFLQFPHLIDALPPHLAPFTSSFNLSAAVKLARLAFLSTQPGVGWILETLQTVESRDLQEITLQFEHNALMHGLDERVLQQWQDLDRLLVRFWTSHSIRPKVMYEGGMGWDMRNDAPSVLPELTSRGLVDMVEYNH